MSKHERCERQGGIRINSSLSLSPNTVDFSDLSSAEASLQTQRGPENMTQKSSNTSAMIHLINGPWIQAPERSLDNLFLRCFMNRSSC